MSFLKINDIDHFVEHHGYYYPDDTISVAKLPTIPPPVLFKGRNDCICFAVQGQTRKVETSYYIGVDWLYKEKLAVYVQPKLK